MTNLKEDNLFKRSEFLRCRREIESKYGLQDEEWYYDFIYQAVIEMCNRKNKKFKLKNKELKNDIDIFLMLKD